MQRSWVSNRDRVTALGAVVLVHAGILAALLTLGPGKAVLEAVNPLKVFDVLPDPPPPPPPPPAIQESKKLPKPEGASAPPAKKAEATPIVKPPPKVVLPPPPPPVVAAPTPGTGAAPSQGAAPVDGPGTGAGGTGNGTGSGGSGSGPGGGGSGGQGVGPSVIDSTKLTGRSYPAAVLRAWPRGRRVLVAVRVQVDGRATDCKINGSSGDPNVDAWTCRLVEERVRFKPALDDNGRPYVRWYGYIQAPVNF
ncbi:TonB family protein [Sphingomonas rosea]|uniref:TonB family protein n=1 Tax=Sphingomonas rosea TaxID=335605 RepID=UPI0031DF415E